MFVCIEIRAPRHRSLGNSPHTGQKNGQFSMFNFNDTICPILCNSRKDQCAVAKESMWQQTYDLPQKKKNSSIDKVHVSSDSASLKLGVRCDALTNGHNGQVVANILKATIKTKASAQKIQGLPQACLKPLNHHNFAIFLKAKTKCFMNFPGSLSRRENTMVMCERLFIKLSVRKYFLKSDLACQQKWTVQNTRHFHLICVWILG